MITWSTLLLAIRIVFELVPDILSHIKEEQQKQLGRDEIAKAVVKRFKDVSKRAEDARAAARDDIANGVSRDRHQRD